MAVLNSNLLSIKEARRLALRRQLLSGESSQLHGKDGVAQVVDQLGYVQIDSIAVLRRAHHHVLWNRCRDYSTDILHELCSVERGIFEYWGHAASFLPMSDYRYYLPRMRSYQQPKSKWQRNRLEQYGHLMGPVLERIRAEGPLGSKDFEPPPGVERGTWWDWKPAKIALEMLFDRGELMITERRNFQRIYDLTERVLPSSVDTRYPESDELGRFLVRRALSAHGVAQAKEISGHIRGTDRRAIEISLQDLVDAGEVVKVTIADDSSAQYYALADELNDLGQQQETGRRLLLLSPFDNLVIQRERLLRLFGFDYTLECYVPASKRRYGYFVLPVFWGDSAIGRLDAKADRKSQTLIVHTIHFEPDYGGSDETMAALAKALARFMRFNECSRVSLGTVTPTAFALPLQRFLDECEVKM
jgi:uncharacterized protein YcaQ